MLILGIDTATVIGSVGLVRDGEPVGEEFCRAASNHTETLFPLVTTVLAQAQVSLGEVEGIGVSIGPGSFTGLRIALSAVKGFSYALGHQVVGISTLEALARTVTDWEGLICPLLDARKREVYAALFRCDQNSRLERLTPDLALLPQMLLERITEPCLFLGDGAEFYGELIEGRCGSDARLLPFATYHPRGAVVAMMAWERLCRGEHDDLDTLMPCYVRSPEAELKRQE
ncbi:MAG: tRNA (adenosine(37)-N6)-threonylcarbamoyltransferase complex dimerization subunit type 1 TsaB [Candidatus Binatia bacterium]